MNDYRAFIKTPIDGRNSRDQNFPFFGLHRPTDHEMYPASKQEIT